MIGCGLVALPGTLVATAVAAQTPTLVTVTFELSVDGTPAPSEHRTLKNAEREGFEPSIRVTPDTAFPVRRPRPD